MLIPNDLHQFDENLAENSPNLSIRVPQKKKHSHDNEIPHFENSTLRLKTETSDIIIPKSPNSKSSSKEE